MMERREFLTIVTAGLLSPPLAAEAQEYKAGQIRRIGFLSVSSASDPANDGLRQGLREHGYVEGRNLLIEEYLADGRDERLPGFAAELVRLRIEVIVTLGASAAFAAKKATTKVPIVLMVVSDPVGLGLVPSLARPAGNITGITNLAVDLTGKRLEVLKEAVPSLKSVAILTHPGNPANALFLSEEQVAAHRLGLEVGLVEVREPSEFETALATIAHERTRAVVLVPGGFLFAHRIQIAELATKRRIPLMGWQRALAESGALISYGPNSFDIGRRAATYVDRILNGAKPVDLPVEQPSKFELVINLKTAKALGLTIPPSLLQRADQVIE